MILLAILLHIAVAAQAFSLSVEVHEWSRMVRDRVAQNLQSLYEVELAKPPEPEPPPPPPPEVKEDKPEPPPPPVAAVKNAAPPPPPEAAQAGKTLTQEPDPNDPVDLTGIAQGNGEYAGGVTSSRGTSKTAVNNLNARAGGVPGGTGQPQAVGATGTGDKSRAAGLLGSTDWNCSSFWPAEADSEQIDQALVTIQVMVGPDGKPQRVDIVKDPGHGFGLAARRCAMRESFQTALDSAGNPIVMQTKPFRVRFER